jgi:hypothetical protein
MFLGRAKYNLLQYKKREVPSLNVLDWEVRDYRSLSNEALFRGLQALGVDLQESDLKRFASEDKSLEEMNFQEKGEAYLHLFELWRRFCPSQKSIAIFCDELDAFIDAYDRGEEHLNEAILTEFFDILDESVDGGLKPKVVFKEISGYLAHDLESFFYNYIYDQIDKNNEMGASEILENISDYLEGSLWFEFLRIRLLKGASEEDSSAMMARFLEQLESKPQIELAFEVLYYMIETGHKELFINTYKSILKQIKHEDHFMEMLEIIFSYYSLNDLEKEESLIRELIKQRKNIPLEKKVGLKEKKILESFI